MDREFLIDLFADFGPVTIRPMFSGEKNSAGEMTPETTRAKPFIAS